MEEVKITKKNSLLYTREWMRKAFDEGNASFIPNRRVSNGHSTGEIIALKYFEQEIIKTRLRSDLIEVLLKIKNDLIESNNIKIDEEKTIFERKI